MILLERSARVSLLAASGLSIVGLKHALLPGTAVETGQHWSTMVLLPNQKPLAAYESFLVGYMPQLVRSDIESKLIPNHTAA